MIPRRGGSSVSSPACDQYFLDWSRLNCAVTFVSASSHHHQGHHHHGRHHHILSILVVVTWKQCKQCKKCKKCLKQFIARCYFHLWWYFLLALSISRLKCAYPLSSSLSWFLIDHHGFFSPSQNPIMVMFCVAEREIYGAETFIYCVYFYILWIKIISSKPTLSKDESKLETCWSRDGICHSRHSRRGCKIFASGVNFSRNNAVCYINESKKLHFILVSSLKLLTYY